MTNQDSTNLIRNIIAGLDEHIDRFQQILDDYKVEDMQIPLYFSLDFHEMHVAMHPTHIGAKDSRVVTALFNQMSNHNFVLSPPAFYEFIRHLSNLSKQLRVYRDDINVLTNDWRVKEYIENAPVNDPNRLIQFYTELGNIRDTLRLFAEGAPHKKLKQPLEWMLRQMQSGGKIMPWHEMKGASMQWNKEVYDEVYSTIDSARSKEKSLNSSIDALVFAMVWAHNERCRDSRVLAVAAPGVVLATYRELQKQQASKWPWICRDPWDVLYHTLWDEKPHKKRQVKRYLHICRTLKQTLELRLAEAPTASMWDLIDAIKGELVRLGTVYDRLARMLPDAHRDQGLQQFQDRLQDDLMKLGNLLRDEDKLAEGVTQAHQVVNDMRKTLVEEIKRYYEPFDISDVDPRLKSIEEYTRDIE